MAVDDIEKTVYANTSEVSSDALPVVTEVVPTTTWGKFLKKIQLDSSNSERLSNAGLC
jgi:NCS1 family nucleobase:cation symporter-1